MREIVESITISAAPAKVFETLLQPSDIVKWWTAESAIILSKEGGTYSVRWGDNPDHPEYITTAKIIDYDPPNGFSLVNYEYWSKDGKLPFEADWLVRFQISEGTRTMLTVTQTGFPSDPQADEFYRSCVQGWKDTLLSIKKCLEQAHVQ